MGRNPIFSQSEYRFFQKIHELRDKSGWDACRIASFLVGNRTLMNGNNTKKKAAIDKGSENWYKIFEEDCKKYFSGYESFIQKIGNLNCRNVTENNFLNS